MRIVHARPADAAKPKPEISKLLRTLTATDLRAWVERIAVPRHYEAEPEQNRATADWLATTLVDFGLIVERQGPYANVVATPSGMRGPAVLVGAHYDSVPKCPGADDNGSAVAALLGCAAACSLWRPELPVIFVAFNREEDGMVGSRDFVESLPSTGSCEVTCAHILEMVGYASDQPGSQRVPTGLPIQIDDTGNFLGLLANGPSGKAMDFILRQVGGYTPELPVTGLKVKLGMEKLFPVLARSDHVPFWARNIPAVMWTDTSEFRNHHYHRPTDTPDTLNYEFLLRVTRLLTASVVSQALVLQRLSD